MEGVSTALANLASNGIYSLGTVVLILLILIIAVKKGLIQYNGKGVRVGNEQERRIIQRQTTFVHGRLDAIANLLLKEHPDLDEYKTKWICKCIELEWVRAIHYNHCEDTVGYRNDRVIAIRDIVQKKTSHDYFYSNDFIEFVKDHVQEVVTQLVKIRHDAY